MSVRNAALYLFFPQGSSEPVIDQWTLYSSGRERHRISQSPDHKTHFSEVAFNIFWKSCFPQPYRKPCSKGLGWTLKYKRSCSASSHLSHARYEITSFWWKCQVSDGSNENKKQSEKGRSQRNGEEATAETWWISSTSVGGRPGRGSNVDRAQEVDTAATPGTPGGHRLTGSRSAHPRWVGLFNLVS